MKSRNDSQIIMVPTPRSQPSLVREFEGRRAGIIKALTTDFETFYEQCDPEKGPLRLFGLPNATWEVKPDVGQIPPEFPEPVLGINFLRDERQEKDWLSYVAVCSDAWLLSIVFYSVGLCGHEKETRKTLFDNINDLPTVLEVVTEAIQAKELAASAAAAAVAVAATAAANNNRRLSRRIKNRQSKSQPESSNTSASKSRK